MKIFSKKNRFLLIIFVCLVLTVPWCYFVFRPVRKPLNEKAPGVCSFLRQESTYADSLIACMSLREKAGQLIMIGIRETRNEQALTQQVIQYKPCGFFLAGGAISNINKVTGVLQNHSDIPLFFAVKAPAGLYSPDDSLASCAAMPGPDYYDEHLLSDLTALTVKQMKHCGLHINLVLPVHAVNMNYDMPLSMSFARSAMKMQKKLLFIQNQMNKAGLIPCVYGLEDNKQLQFACPAYGQQDSLRKKPLKTLINSGLSGMFLDQPDEKLTDSLIKKVKYEGLVFSVLSEKNEDESQAYKLLNSGTDIMIIPPEQIFLADKIISAISKGKIPEDTLDKKVKRILLAKSWMKLVKNRQTNADSARYYSSYWNAKLLYYRIIESSVVLINNRNNTVPLCNTEKEKMAIIRIGGKTGNDFVSTAGKYASAMQFAIGPEATDAEQQALINKVRSCTVIIFAVYESPAYMNNNYTKIQQLTDRISEHKKAIVALFGSAGFLASFRRVPCMVWSLSSSAVAQQTIASVIFGGEKISGSLPYSFSQEYCYNDGLVIDKPTCFKYTEAEDAGIDGALLYKIDSIADFAIKAGAFPGCQVFFARHGKVFYNKSFGTHTYDEKQKVKNTDLYDLASVTKVVTTLALMSLYDKGKINLDTTLNYYFSDLDKNARGKKVRDSKLNNVRLSELLTHRSGLPEGLPVGLFISPEYALNMMEKQMGYLSDTGFQPYQQSENGNHLFITGLDTNLLHTTGDSLLKYLFSNTKKPEYTVEVAKNMFLRAIMTDSLWQLAKQTWIRPDKGYLYSDLNLYLVMKVVEKVANMPLDKYLDQVYLALLNLKRMGFNPLKKFKAEEIVPTEQDNYFRRQLIHGYVHDPMAALLGGIGGNAGLFSDARDLGVLMQMLLNKGRYGAKTFLSEKTVALFTSAQNGTYRGLGFDRKGKPDAKMVAPGASLSTFGHTGFTGTCVWADPENELVFVFLSNRVCPASSNQKINNYRIRQNIQQVVYDAMIEQ